MREETVPFSNFALSCWLAPRAGSCMNTAMRSAVMGPGTAGGRKGKRPAEVFAYGAADDVAECSADEDGYVEDGEDAVALVWLVKISQERRGEDAEAGFAYAESSVAEIERAVGVNAGGEEIDAAPEERGDDDHGL